MIINKIRFISILCLCAGIFAQNPIDNYLSGNNTLTVIGGFGDGVDKPRDLDFHPTIDNQLWILNQGRNPMQIILNILQMYVSLKIQILLLQFTTHMEMVSAVVMALALIRY